jgi:hypothetical protein
MLSPIQASMKLELKNVTIVSIDCVNAELALLAIRKSLNQCDFSKAILFTDNKDIQDDHISVHSIEKINSKNEYSKFLIKDLNKYIETEFVLIVQWDGFVVNTKAWNPKFLNYDYIGAKWYWHKDGKNIGNGGFSLRSKRLLSILSSNEFDFIDSVNEDEQICRFYYDKLVNNFSIKFPPEELADEFSYERSVPEGPTFGFHGAFNLWRHLDDSEAIDLYEKLNLKTVRSDEYTELILQYFLLRKFNMMRVMYSVFLKCYKKDTLKENILKLTQNEDFSSHILKILEKI